MSVFNLPLLKNCHKLFAEVLPVFWKSLHILIELVILKDREQASMRCLPQSNNGLNPLSSNWYKVSCENKCTLKSYFLYSVLFGSRHWAGLFKEILTEQVLIGSFILRPWLFVDFGPGTLTTLLPKSLMRKSPELLSVLFTKENSSDRGRKMKVQM